MAEKISEYVKALERLTSDGSVLETIICDTDGYEHNLTDEQLDKKFAKALNEFLDEIERGNYQQEDLDN